MAKSPKQNNGHATRYLIEDYDFDLYEILMRQVDKKASPAR